MMYRSVVASPLARPVRVTQAVRRRMSRAGLASWGEPLGLGGLLALIFIGMLFRLRSVVDASMDEGTYLYAGKLFAEGFVPYRDFLVAHPPGIVVLTGAWVRLFGSDLMAARIAYLVLTLISTVPLYLITRSLTRSRTTALFSVSVYTTGMLFLSNMGRTIRLEPMMNACLIAAFACYVLRPNSMRWRIALGAFLAGALLFKLVAVLPAGLLVLGDLIWVRPRSRGIRLWLAAAGGAALVLVPAGALLLAQPHFVDDVIRSQVNRPGLPLSLRLHYLRQDFVRYPPILVALAAALWFMLKAADRRVRILSLIATGSTVVLPLAFKTYFHYYYVGVMPWIAVLFTLVAGWVLRRFLAGWWRPAMVAGAVVVGFGAAMLYGEVYRRSGEAHSSASAQALAQIRGGSGYLYTMDPTYSLWADRDLYPWYYTVDSLIPRITGQIGEEDFITVFSHSQTLMLWKGELDPYPGARAYVEQHFTLLYEDAGQSVWARHD